MNGRSKKNSGYYLLLIFPVFMILFGGIFLTIGLGFNYARNVKKEHCSEPVTAVVFDYRHQNASTSASVAPMMKYTYNGKEYRYTPSTYSNPPEFEIGENVEAFCNPDKPGELYYESRTINLIAAIFSIVGGVICGAGGIILIVAGVIIRKKTKPPVDEIAAYENEFR
ncbi:MAG: DUF3592 domain-containing protein [Oscillospiraceae bacterium]